MRLDSAIIKALSLDSTKTTAKSHGGSGFTTTAKITTTTEDGTEKHIFMKTGKGKSADVMFKGEHASLNAIHSIVPTLCPQSFAEGPLEDSSDGAYLVTDFLDMSSRASISSTTSKPSDSLAAKLAKLHTTPAPIPAGYEKPMFGFPVPTCCGDTEQPNSFSSNWADFYAQNRLLAILEKSERNNGKDATLRTLVEKTAYEIVPRLLGSDHLNNGKGIVPVVVHGDLWSGNKGQACIGGQGPVEDVVFDPSACYAHSEYELGIMQMFGGFGKEFMREYHSRVEKTEPVDEYADRVKLYEVYHHLNHFAIFGGGYRGGAVGILRDLCGKYGTKEEL